ncbi:hypothetical protein XENTR_v10024771 [Xenopus tropicalis]|nr:hypothetical protein XENTR_v10024771 [Xenopus tropicalis]
MEQQQNGPRAPQYNLSGTGCSLWAVSSDDPQGALGGGAAPCLDASFKGYPLSTPQNSAWKPPSHRKKLEEAQDLCTDWRKQGAADAQVELGYGHMDNYMRLAVTDEVGSTGWKSRKKKKKGRKKNEKEGKGREEQKKRKRKKSGKKQSLNGRRDGRKERMGRTDTEN